MKVYVSVTASFQEGGLLSPHAITWQDGTQTRIDRIADIHHVPVLPAGDQCDRYTLLINGQSADLFFERNASLSGNNIGRWFVEQSPA